MDTKHIDKNSINHFFANYIPSLFGVFGLGVATGASITKEWYDKKSYGHWCYWDLFFDGLGMLCGYLTHMLVMTLIII